MTRGDTGDVVLVGVDGSDDALRAARLTLVVGEADPFAPAAAVTEQAARLTAAGVGYELVRFAGGHRLDAGTLGRVLID